MNGKGIVVAMITSQHEGTGLAKEEKRCVDEAGECGDNGGESVARQDKIPVYVTGFASLVASWSSIFQYSLPLSYYFAFLLNQ